MKNGRFPPAIRNEGVGLVREVAQKSVFALPLKCFHHMVAFRFFWVVTETCPGTNSYQGSLNFKRPSSRG